MGQSLWRIWVRVLGNALLWWQGIEELIQGLDEAYQQDGCLYLLLVDLLLMMMMMMTTIFFGIVVLITISLSCYYILQHITIIIYCYC